MSVRKYRSVFLGSSALALLFALGGPALSQDTNAPPAANAPADTPSKPTPTGSQLPEIKVTAQHREAVRRRRQQQANAPLTPALTPAETVAKQNADLDGARNRIVAPTGASVYEMSHEAIQALPQGTNTPLDKALLQIPGVTQDSAASGELHIRNEHANLQYRINGIMLPDGVGAFGQILDTKMVGSMSMLTGALPAQYGLRTAGVLDIQTNPNVFNNSGSISVYGGSHGTITPSFDYGGTAGQTQYYVSGSYFGSNMGIENPTPNKSAIHDHTDQGKGFVYLSTLLDETSRIVFIGGTSNSSYQIPNNPGQPPAFGNVPAPYDSAFLNERQTENNQFGILAYQKSINGLDMQFSAFTRYSELHFMPDGPGDLAFNGVASDVYRRSQTTGISSDNAYRWSDSHTARFGFQVSAERSLVNNVSTVFNVDNVGDPIVGSNSPFSFIDSSSKLGWLASAYVSDEWRITNQLTLTTGLRFDQMWSYTDANQLSPRVNLTYKPFEGTTFHAGYARNFTPPPQVLAAPTNLTLVNGTTLQPLVSQNDPVQPERSNVYDAGVTQKVLPGLEVGIDAYYKTATNLLDDGQFGAAYVLTAFNYARGTNTGIEFKGTYVDGGFRAYANFAIARQLATNVSSNQYLFDPDELAYIAQNSVYTDHAQFYTGSAGASYLWNGTRFSADVIFGSGLRSGFANTDSLPWYSQVNLGISHEFLTPASTKPLTVRFDVVNLFDNIYEIRDGSGIGVFAPQYGPRRGFFVGLSQKL